MKRFLICALLSMSLAADAQMFEDWSLNGFGTIKAGYTESEGDNLDLLQFYPENDKVYFDTESLVGIQLHAPLTENLSAVTQVLVKGSRDFDPVVKWAYLKYSFGQNYSVMVGRMAMPLFAQAQTEFVGYLHDFGRLPKSVYIGHEFNTLDGIGLDTKHFLDYGWFLRTQWNFGQWDGDLFQSVTNDFFTVEMRDVLSINLELSRNEWTLVGGHLRGEISSPVLDDGIVDIARPILDAQGLTVEQIQPLLDVLFVTGETINYNFAGFKYNSESGWKASGEISYYGIEDSIDSFNLGWYLALGKQIDRYTITGHIESYRQPPNGYSQLNSVPEHLQPLGRYAVDLFAIREFKAAGITFRYELSDSVAFKIDFTEGIDERSTVGRYRYGAMGIDFVF